MSLNYKAKRTGLKGFLLFHSEKALLVLAFVALAAFFALGYGGESFDSSRTPDRLKTEVENVKSKLKTDTWEAVAEEPERLAPTNHGRRAQIARNPVSADLYVAPVLATPIFKELVKRTDPDIYPPEQIEVAVSIGAVAQRTPRGGTIQDTLADAVDPKIDAPKQPRSSRTQRGPAGSPYGSAGEMMMEGPGYGSGSPYGTDPNKPTVKQLTPYLQQKFQKDYYTISAKANLKGAYVVAVKAVVPLKRQQDEFERTFKDATGFDPMRDRPEIVWFEAERAEVAPGMTEDQLKWTLISDTDKALEQARLAASQPQEPADPRYLLPGMITFPIPPMVMVKLKDLGLHSLVPARKTPASIRAERQAKRGPNGEVLAADGTATGEEPQAAARGPRALPRGPGMGGPGEMLSGGSPYGEGGYGDSSMYGDPSMMYGEGGGEMYGDPSMMYGEGGGDMYGGSAYGSSAYGSTGSGYGNPMAGVDYKLVRFFDFEAQPGKTYRYRVRLFYRDPNNLFAIRSGAGTAAAAAGAYGAAGGAMYEAASSYSGSSYGSGMGGTGGPLKEYMLSPEVLTRLNTIPEEEGGAEEVYYRTTEWSVPSEDVVVPFAPEKRFAGAGEGAKRFPIPGGGDFPIVEPQVKVAVSRWDNARAVDVPTEIQARRGSVLNKVGDVDVLHPLLLAGAGMGMGGGGMEMLSSGSYGEGGPGGAIDPYATPVDPYSQQGVAATMGPQTPIRRLEGYEFRTDSIVLDIRGGEKLPGGDPRNPQNSPTFALMVDRFGNLEFASEVEDAEGYRDTLFIDPTPEKKAAAALKAQQEAAAASNMMDSQQTGP